MNVAAVVLAAGASRRMGRPKALLQWRGQPFFRHCVDLARAAGCLEVVVVEGACPLGAPPGLRIVRNEGWERGPLSSLQTGLGALQSRGTAVLVCTVDRPHVRPATARALVQAHLRAPSSFVQPRWEAIPGHPVLYPWHLAVALQRLCPTDTARAVTRRADVTRTRVWVDVDDPAVAQNLDTPAALAAAGVLA